MNARRKKKWKRQKMMEYGVLGLARKGRWKSKKGAQEKAGNIILRAWYRKLAYKRVKDLKSRRQKLAKLHRQAQRMRSIITVQKLWRGRKAKIKADHRKYDKIVTRLQRRFRHWSEDRKESAARVLQRHVRGYKMRSRFREVLDELQRFHKPTSVIQRIVRGFLTRRRIRRQRDTARRLEDVRWAGLCLAEQTKVHWMRVLTVRDLRNTKKKETSLSALREYGLQGIYSQVWNRVWCSLRWC